MSVIDIDVVDSIGTVNDELVSLLITDHLDWVDEKEHMIILQNKINKYLSFIESGEIYTAFPKSKNKKFEIIIYAKYALTNDAKIFIDKVKNILEGAGYCFVWKLSP